MSWQHASEGTKWFHNPITQEAKRLPPDQCPEGWVLGRPNSHRKAISVAKTGRKRKPFTEEHLRKMSEASSRSMRAAWQDPVKRKNMIEGQRRFFEAKKK